MSKYWRIFCEEVVPDVLGISTLTEEQANALTKEIINAKDMEYDACGTIEADRSCQRMHDNDVRNSILNVVASLCRDLDEHSRNNGIFDKLNNGQKAALSKIFNLRDHLAHEHKIMVKP